MDKEVIEKIFEEHGFDVNGKEVILEIEKRYGETDCLPKRVISLEGYPMFLDGVKYIPNYEIEVEIKYYIDGEVVPAPCEDFDDVETNIELKAISVSRTDGASDDHTFVWNR